MLRHLTLAAIALLAQSVTGQTSQILVDLGTSQFPTNGTSPLTWNDLDETNMAVPFELVDTTNQATGITWSLPGTLFTGANSAGTASPQAGSPLAQFPPSATRDVMYGSNGATVAIDLTGFGPNTLVDLTFAASRMNVTDARTTDYLVQGFNAGSATLDPSNNTSRTVKVSSILADATGKIAISVRAAASNTNVGTRYFYLGALQIDATTTATRPAILGFDQPGLAVSRAQGVAPFGAPLTVLESTGATPPVTLSAVDDATGAAPTWMALPGGATAGAPFTVTFDGGAVGLGAYSATITASAAGYPDSSVTASFAVRDPDVRNLLFYGNSYSQGNQGMPGLAGFIAEDAGHASPNVVAMLVGGQNLQYHLTNPTQAAAITDALPLGEEWDAVVMQGFSLEATAKLGDPAAFRANALAILTSVRAHSPSAKGVMFQTWARGPGHSVYNSTYTEPLEMHGEIRDSYQLAVADMNAAFGPGIAFNGAVGDGVALLAFDPTLYTADLSHPTPPTTLLAAMVVYQAIYRERVCDVTPDFAGGSNLVSRLTGIGLGSADWIRLSGIAERVADSSLRRYPGSGEDLLLLSGVGGAMSACPSKTAGLGDPLSATMTSPNGLYGGVAGVLVLDAHPTGFPPGQLTPWPEIQFHPAIAVPVATSPQVGGGLGYSLTIPVALPGVSLVLQGLALGASPTTGNPLFTTTDGHEIRLQ